MKLGDVILLGLTIVGVYVVGKKILTAVRKPVSSGNDSVKVNMTDAKVETESPVVVVQPGISLNSNDFDVVSWVQS
jgi:hypothetical protein